MKVMVREVMQFVPGKMSEGLKLLDEMMELVNKKYGTVPDVKKYTPWIGGGNAINTVVIEMEWDSFTEMAEFFEKSYTDPEMMETMPQWEAIEESHKEELYVVME